MTDYNEKGIPFVNVEPLPPFREGYRFYCPYCKRFHHHGRGLGHRVAHCDGESLYNKTGYILRLKKEKNKGDDRHE